MESSVTMRKVLAGDRVLLTTGTSLDNNNAHEMVAAIQSAQDDGFKYILIDTGTLEFLSSAGVGAVLGTIETSREMGGDIILCNLSESVLHVLKVLDLADYLTIAAGTKEAEAQCTASE